MDFNYMRALPEHITQIHGIERLCFSDPWSVDSFIKEFEDGLARYFIAETRGVVAGFGGYWSIVGEAHITNIAVHPDFRNLGAGTGLINCMICDIQTLGHSAATLEVREDNYPAIRLYERFGFERAGIRRKYYDRGTKDALIMWKKII